ncbi:hypothetical protein [Nonomuraea zeae]|uniref:Uncharacterized protein n=1 Tax=Nonomuraea zeae TaxID=1642303 RepID=A0A5S4H3J7_9ACTN|nr:hypothetical protein [Nonomuraea zeae]TMR39823.1 hypothetical protein ETD85_00130 [Nonomuraea zeae]
MELIVMLLLPLPLGYLVRSRVAAYLAYIGAHSFVFTFQTMTLTKAWVGGAYDAFAKDPNQPEWPYAVVNLAIYAAGLGLVALGAWLRDRRRARRSSDGIDLAAPGRA